MRRQMVRSGARPGGGATARAGTSHLGEAPRRAPGPCPVRPHVHAVSLRPGQAQRPACRALPVVPGRRILVRPGVAASRTAAVRGRVHRVGAALLCAVASAAVVVGLGTLGSSAEAWRADGSSRTVTFTVDAEQTVWDLARRSVPAAHGGSQPATGSELAAVAQQIVMDNSLTSVRLRPGQVLRVTTG